MKKYIAFVDNVVRAGRGFRCRTKTTRLEITANCLADACEKAARYGIVSMIWPE